MKKKHIFLIFIISITFFAIIIYFLFNIQKGDTKNKKILYRSNKQFEKQIHEKINNFDMKNLWSDLELWNHMNITMEEIATYGATNGELIGYFYEKGYYNLLYLYTCKKNNKFQYTCPVEWFNEFIKQFSWTWWIKLIKWESVYFQKWDNLIYLLSSKDSVNFIIKNYEK